jgi:RNA polymerase sigma-70 factor, ECF subfamily
MTTSSGPERATAQLEICRLIERAIDDQPELCRVVLVMREIEDMSVEETAGFLGLCPATVKYRLPGLDVCCAKLLLRNSPQP